MLNRRAREMLGQDSTDLKNVVLFLLGTMAGSIITQFLVQGANPVSCEQLGITVAARTQTERSSGPALLIQTSSYSQVRVNGSYKWRSPFTGVPSPEIARAWEVRYWPVWLFAVDEEAFQASHPQHMSSAVQIDDEDDDASNGHYLATLEASHQLHCLYNLYRASYLDHGGKEQSDYNEDPAAWHSRVDHCVDILRQKLECDRDTTLITYSWVKGKKGPTANFNVERTCPDLGWIGLRRWLQQRRIAKVPTKPANATELPIIP